jgi:hypothetical protein
MLGMQWNALRVGDHVLVHDDADLTAPPTQGTVSIVQSRRDGWNDLAIRLSGGSGRVVRPRAGACHLLPLHSAGCWRCDILATAHVDDLEPSGT